MSIKTRLSDDMKAALRAHDSAKLNTLRLLLSEVKNFEIDNGVQEDAGVQKLVAKMLKQWHEAKQDYLKGNRADLVAEADSKIAILEGYLPQQLSDAGLNEIINSVKSSFPQLAVGPLTGMVMKQVAGRADGARVAAAVKNSLI